MDKLWEKRRPPVPLLWDQLPAGELVFNYPYAYTSSQGFTITTPKLKKDILPTSNKKMYKWYIYFIFIILLASPFGRVTTTACANYCENW